MGKPSGFIEWPRVGPPRRPVEERLRDYKEIYLERAPEVIRQQGGRCMDCGVPFCQQGCPLGNMIPDWNDLVYRDQWRRAYERLDATNNFPELTGRLCPAPCEAACVLAIDSPAVTIEQIEKEIIERAYAEGWVVPRPPRERTGKHVAVIGSGPAGLAAAQQLCRAGHQVTVLEADDRLGGMLRYGIPDFKMEKWPIERRLEQLCAEGVEFRTGVRAGVDVGWRELRDRHDAVLVAVGARVHRDLDVPGRNLDGVCFAMDYLEQQNRVVAGDAIDPAARLDGAGKRVVILGGGDTGSDCYGTALRQGATDVCQIQLWPAPPEARPAGNPWPAWPMVFRTSSSQEEGGRREFAILSKELVAGDDGKLAALRCVRIEPETLEDGRRRPREIPGSEHDIPCELLVLAIGFSGPDSSTLSAELGVKLDARGNVVTTEFATNVPGVYCAGDAMRGASLIVWAIADGREAARAIDAQLRDGQPARLPSKGSSAPF